MQGVALIAILAALAGFISCGAWYRAGQALKEHGALASQFKSQFVDATVSTSAFLGLTSSAMLLLIYVSFS